MQLRRDDQSPSGQLTPEELEIPRNHLIEQLAMLVVQAHRRTEHRAYRCPAEPSAAAVPAS